MKSIRYAIYVSMVLHFLRKILHKEHATKPVPCHNDLMKPGDPQGKELEALLLDGLYEEMQNNIDREILESMKGLTDARRFENGDIRVYFDKHAAKAGEQILHVDYDYRPKVSVRKINLLAVID